MSNVGSEGVMGLGVFVGIGFVLWLFVRDRPWIWASPLVLAAVAFIGMLLPDSESVGVVYEKLEQTTASRPEASASIPDAALPGDAAAADSSIPSDASVVVSHSGSRRSASQVATDELRMDDLWKQAQQRLDLYHRLATSQSKVSFRMLMAVATLGFALLAFVVWRASVADSTAGAFVAGGVGTLGAALAAFIGRTFQATYREATNRLTDYFAQPVELTRLLAAERMLHRLRGDSSEEGVLMIIGSALSPRPSIDSTVPPKRSRRAPAPKATNQSPIENP